MVFFVTALKIEAEPIIRQWQLKLDHQARLFPVYKGEDAALVISGIGKVRSAMAALFLSGLYEHLPGQIWVNWGFCGASDVSLAAGQLVIAHQVKDMDTGRDAYPDMLAGLPATRISLACHARPVRRMADHQRELSGYACHDMESSGFMDAAGHLTAASKILVTKVISDHLEPDQIDLPHIREKLSEHMPLLHLLIGKIESASRQSIIASRSEDDILAAGLARHLHCSETMQHDLFKIIRQARARGIDPGPVLQQAGSRPCPSKREGKQILEQIRQQLKTNDLQHDLS